MKRVRAGSLRTPVFLGRPLIVRDAAGGEVITWEELATWALIESTGGREWATASMLKDSVDAKITVRLSDGWLPVARWRVRDAISNTLYDLVTVMLAPGHGSAECLAHTAVGSADAR